MKKLVYGCGINNADYNTSWYVGDKRAVCPFYKRWTGMLSRCYSEKFKRKTSSYLDCRVSDEWKYFMNFKLWMEKQDWEGKELDKDLLVEGNRVYGPNTCMFIDQEVNTFILENKNRRGDWPLGVYFNKPSKKFLAYVREERRNRYLGQFGCPNEAHNAWREAKRELAVALAAKQANLLVSLALLERYKSHGESL